MRNSFWAILTCITGICQAQVDSLRLDSMSLDEAIVRAEMDWARPESQMVDSNMVQLFRTSNLNELLRTGQPLHVKSYGNTGLATVAYRGLDATALSMEWNGVRLNSSLNGMMDLSTIPVFFFDGAQLYTNTSSSNVLGGSIGANLVLQNEPLSSVHDFSGKSEVLLGSGSFGKYYGGFRHRSRIRTNKNYAWDVALFYSRAQNDYEYKPLAFATTTRMLELENAANIQLGAMVNYVSHFKNGNLKTGYMLNILERELPATQLEPLSVKEQIDLVHTLYLNRKWLKKKYVLNWNNSFSDQNQTYSDSNANLESNLATSIVQNSLAIKFHLAKPWMLSSRIASYFAVANTSNYGNQKSQFYVGQESSLRYRDSLSSVQIGLKSLFVDDPNLWFMPSISVRRSLHKTLVAHGLIERSGRLPTLNEMYWEPGGKLDVKPMTAYKYELGINYKKRPWEFSQIAFYTDVDNYIEWLPNGPNFSVVQQNKVKSAGSETMLRFSHSQYAWKWQSALAYNYTRAVLGNTFNKEVNQRIFVPKHTGSFNLSLQYRQVQLAYYHSLTSLRYTSSDLSNSIRAYQVGDIVLAHTGKKIHAQFIVRNLWNEEYYVLPFRPMPFRNFELNIKYQFIQNINITDK